MALIFPQLSPEYYDEKDRTILQKMEYFYSQSITTNFSFWGEADIDLRFEAGDQTVYNDLYGNLPANRKRQFSFNRIRRVINMIDGFQRRNRKSIIVAPVENADDFTADQFTKIMYWLDSQENFSETVSDAFRGALVTGMNLLQVWVDYRNDPISGNIKVDNCSYNSFLIDPFFRKPDLSDCTGIWKRTFLTKREVISLLPEHESKILGLMGQDYRDGKFQFLPESYNYSKQNLLAYDEFYYRDYRKQKMLIDTQTGETMEWRSSDDESLRRFLETYPQVIVSEDEIPTVKLAIVVQGKVFYDGPNPLGIDKYPFVPVFAYYNPQMPYYPWRVQGVVRGLRDAQYLYNRRRIIELDILESQITSGFKYKESALVNPKDIFLQGQGKGLALKDEAQMTDVEQIQAPQIPPSMIQLSELLGQEIQQISGVNEELLGSAVDEKAGILAMLRQGAGLTTLQKLFDQLDFSCKNLGKIFIDIIQSNFTPGKIKRILNEEPSPQFYNKAFGKYDAAVEEGLNTTTQKQMMFAQLLQLREVGVQVPDDYILDAATIQDKTKLKERIMQAQQQQQQLQQIQLDSQLKEAEARTKLADARATADEGLGLERLSRVEENRALAVERRAEAIKDQYSAVLDLAKALKELESIDLAQLQQLIQLQQLVKSEQMDLKAEQEETPLQKAPTQEAAPQQLQLNEAAGSEGLAGSQLNIAQPPTQT